MLTALKADLANWGTAIPEVADPNYVAAPWITWPLPPIVLHDWGRDGVHPKVPLAADACLAEQRAGGRWCPVRGSNGVKNPADQGFDAAGAPTTRGLPPQPAHVRPTGGDANGVPENTAPYRMFRFVDWDVQPGHLYQYRVQLRCCATRTSRRRSAAPGPSSTPNAPLLSRNALGAAESSPRPRCRPTCA